MAEPSPKRHAPKGRIKARPDDAHPMDTTQAMDTPYTSCTAKSKQSGVRCRRRPIPGHHVCAMHGGKIPQVVAKAQERLLALQFPAIARLGELMAQTEYPSVSIAATKDVLDRTMGKPIESVTHEHSGTMIIRHEMGD